MLASSPHEQTHRSTRLNVSDYHDYFWWQRCWTLRDVLGAHMLLVRHNRLRTYFCSQMREAEFRPDWNGRHGAQTG